MKAIKMKKRKQIFVRSQPNLNLMTVHPMIAREEKQNKLFLPINDHGSSGEKQPFCIIYTLIVLGCPPPLIPYA